VGVSVEGEVRHGAAPTDEEVVALQGLLHDTERVVPELSLGLEGGPAFFRHLRVENVKPGARHGNVRLVAVLLEEHPLQRTRPSEAIVREERSAAREIEQDRVGFWQKLSFFGLEYRDTPVRVDVFEERGRARLAPVYVVLDPFEWNTKLCQQQPDLVTVPRRQVVVQAQSHSDSPPSGP
jgi:hypothetical protein